MSKYLRRERTKAQRSKDAVSTGRSDAVRRTTLPAEKANYCACLTGAVVGLFNSTHFLEP